MRVTTPSSYAYGLRGRRIRSPSSISLNSRPSYPQSPQPMSLVPRPSLDDKGFPQPIGEIPQPLMDQVDSETSSSSGPSPLLSPQRKFSNDEPRAKYIWSPRITDQVDINWCICYNYCMLLPSPSSSSLCVCVCVCVCACACVCVCACVQLFSPFSDDEQSTYELWVCSSDAHHSIAAVIEYSGRFTNVEVGSSLDQPPHANVGVGHYSIDPPTHTYRILSLETRLC